MNSNIIPWTIYLSRLSDFWEPVVTVKDENGILVTYQTTELTIFPKIGAAIIWNPANGKLTMPAAGTFAFNVLMAEIAAYNFELADYKWSVTHTNGKVEGDWMEGVVRVSD